MRRIGFTGDIWPDEIQELLLQAALLPGDAGAAAWAAVRPRINVDHLPGELHRLMPPLSKALTACGVDDPDLPRLKGVYQFSWYRNQLLFADGAALIGSLEAVDVSTMLLRGAAMAVAYHGDAGVRPMNDLDVLVPAREADRARRVAEARGWWPVTGSEPLEDREAAATLRNDQGRVVRLHWQPSRNVSLPAIAWEPMWQRAVDVTFDQTATRVPHPADHLVLACIDGARANSGSTLRWITDVTVLLGAAPDLDWDIIVSEACRHRVSLLVGEALRYLAQAFEAKVPPDVIGTLAATSTTPRERLAHRLSLTTTPRVASAAEVLGRFTRLTADLPPSRAVAAAPGFLQTMLGVEHRRDLPLAVARKAIRAVVSPAPPLASLSTAGSPRGRPGTGSDVATMSAPRNVRQDPGDGSNETRAGLQLPSTGPHPALIEVAAGRGLPLVTDPMPLLRSAFAHGMAGLLLSEIERTDPPWRRIGLAVLTARQASVRSWHERLWAALTSISAILDDAGIDVAIAKGIAAEARWYTRMGERPSNDLDLLLSPAHLDRIDDVVAAIEPSHPLCGKVRRFAQAGNLQSIDLEYQGVPIDLHWDILKLGIPSRNREAIWERTVPFTLPDGRSIRTLDAECSYVHFLVHINKDRFRRLLGFVDVARIYQRENLDHAAMQRLIRAEGIEASVSASWDVVVRTLGLDAPNEFRAGTVRSLIWHIAWRPSVRLRATESTIRFRHRQWLIAVLGRGRAVEAVRCWVRMSLPPADLLAYLHSEYANRWGAEPVSTTRRSRLWALTIGRLQASVRRRLRAAKATRLVAGGARRRRGSSLG